MEVSALYKNELVKYDYSTTPPLDKFTLHSDLLWLTTDALNTPEDMAFFELHAYSCCRAWFMGCAACIKDDPNPMNLGWIMLPYFRMFSKYNSDPQHCLLCCVE